MHASEALERVAAMPLVSVLDVGSGKGEHAAYLRARGKSVCTLDLFPPADIVCDFCIEPIPPIYDCVWASHVLEHQPDVGMFLRKCFECLKPDGILAVTVPPAKHDIVGGHLTIWNAGLLLYNLILAGFDCSLAMVKCYGYNISVIVRKRARPALTLKMDNGDIETLAPYFPFPVQQGFNGCVQEHNW